MDHWLTNQLWISAVSIPQNYMQYTKYFSTSVVKARGTFWFAWISSVLYDRSSCSYIWPPDHSQDFLPAISLLWKGLLCFLFLDAKPCWPPQQWSCCQESSYRWSTFVWLNSSSWHLHVPLLCYSPGKASGQTFGPTRWEMCSWQYRYGSHLLSPYGGTKLWWYARTVVTLADAWICVMGWAVANLCTVWSTSLWHILTECPLYNYRIFQLGGFVWDMLQDDSSTLNTVLAFINSIGLMKSL